MPHSSLSSQLASLNSTNGIFFCESSKSHRQVAGRGLNYSTKHGHLLIQGRDLKRKPSVLHPDVRSAKNADISLSSLRGNAISGLNYLCENFSSILFLSSSEVTISNREQQTPPWSILLGVESLHYDRGLKTKGQNRDFDNYLHDALVCLSLAFGIGSATHKYTIFPNHSVAFVVDHTTSVLAILEYLLQVYHPNVNIPDSMIIAFLPHHRSPIFIRILQLIDIAALSHWTFLRPFVTDNNNIVPRNTISKWGASVTDNGCGNAILMRLCELAKDVAKLFSIEQQYTDFCEKDDIMKNLTVGGSRNVKIGTSLVISFSAVTILEALDIQNFSTGSLSETTVRYLLYYALETVEPFLDFTSNKDCNNNGSKLMNNKSKHWSIGAMCPDWRTLGYVLISALSCRCELGRQARILLANGVINGSLEEYDMLTSFSYSIEGEKNDESVTNNQVMAHAVEMTAEALLVMISLISSSSTDATEKNGMFQLSPSIFQALVKHPILAASLEHIVNEGGNLSNVVKPFLSCFVQMAITQLKKYQIFNNVSKDTENNDNNACLKSVLNLIKAPSLYSIWIGKTNTLTTQIISFILFTVTTLPHKLGNDSGSLYMSVIPTTLSIFCALRKIDATGCDSGIARALFEMTSGAKYNFKMRDIKKITDFLFLTEQNCLKNGRDSITMICDDKYKSEHENNRIDRVSYENKSCVLDLLLPAKIALEHSNTNIRLVAIERLTQDFFKTVGTNDELQIKSNVEDILFSLLRRFTCDDITKVAYSASSALCFLFSEGKISKSFFLKPSVINYVFLALQKWSLVEENRYETENIIKEKKKINNDLDDTNIVVVKDGKSQVSKRKISYLHPDILCNAIKIAAMTAHSMTSHKWIGSKTNNLIKEKKESTTIPVNLDLLINGIVSQMFVHDIIDISQNEIAIKIEIVATSAFLKVFDSNVAIEKMNNEAMHLVSMNSLCLCNLKKSLNSSLTQGGFYISDHYFPDKIVIMRRKFLWIYLQSCKHIMLVNNSQIFVRNVMFNALSILSDYNVKLKECTFIIKEFITLITCLYQCVIFLVKKIKLSDILGLIIKLASIQSTVAFKKVSVPLITSIGNLLNTKRNINNATIILLLESMAHPLSTITAKVRLIKILKAHCSKLSIFKDMSDEVIMYLIVTTMSLLTHSERVVRDSSMILIETLVKPLQKYTNTNETSESVCAVLSVLNSSMKTLLLMEGDSALPRLLVNIVCSQTNPQLICKILLRSCVMSTTAMNNFKMIDTAYFGDGGCHTCASLLVAMQSTGEKYFPLSMRWSNAGRHLLSLFISSNMDEHLHIPTKYLIETVICMLKGVIYIDERIFISSGPFLDKKSKSTSASDSINFISPYPDDMKKSLTMVLGTYLRNTKSFFMHELCESINTQVLGNSCWCTVIFPQLSEKFQVKTLLNLLVLKSIYNMELAGIALLGLSMEASQFTFLISSEQSPASNFSRNGILSLIFVSECICGKASSLSKDENVKELSLVLFDRLRSISYKKSCSIDISINGLDYARMCLLHSLLVLHENLEKHDMLLHSKSGSFRKCLLFAKPDTYYGHIGDNASLLVSLASGSNRSILPLMTEKEKSVTLRLLASLCLHDPSIVIKFLIPAIVDTMLSLSLENETAKNIQEGKEDVVMDLLMTVVPVYCKSMKDNGLSMFELLSVFGKCCNIEGNMTFNTKLILYKWLIDALISVCNEKNSGKCIFSVVSSYLAGNIFLQFEDDKKGGKIKDHKSEDLINIPDNVDEKILSFAMQLLSHSNIIDQIASVFQLLRL